MTEDTLEEKPLKEERYKWDVVWHNVILLGGLHLLTIYSIPKRSELMLKTAIFMKIFRLVANIGVTAGGHRLWSHKSYKAKLPLQILLAIMMTMTYQNSIYVWCRDHRLHHKYSETDADPHNAKRGFFFSHLGWLMVRKHKEVREKGKALDMTDLKANPVVMFQHKYYHYMVFPLAFALPAWVPVYFWDEKIDLAILCSISSYIISVNLTWCINSLAHMYGTKPYDKNSGAVENTLMKYIALGEGFHNYHHTFPWDYKVSEFGFEGRNITSGFIDLMWKIGWGYDLREASKNVILKRAERTGDGSFGGDAINLPKGWLCFALFLLIL